MILSKRSVLWNTKLLAWEGGINFSFTEEENFKDVLNNFLKAFRFASGRINF